jgi:hypothetical protein
MKKTLIESFENIEDPRESSVAKNSRKIKMDIVIR